MENSALTHGERKDRRLELMWVDLTVGDNSPETPQLLTDTFDICRVAGESLDDSRIQAWSPAAICCDYDYPDHRSLERLAWLKSRLPSVPVFAMTVQHSESLAVWTFRAGAIDYLVKPATEQDLLRLIDRIRTIDSAKQTQAARNTHQSADVLPDALPRAPKGLRQKLAPAVFFVKKNYPYRISSNTVARICGLSATHFSRAFREVYGVTFQDFILRVRTTEACRQLRTPGTSITGVAHAVGFSDASYFGRVFKRYVEMSPSEYVTFARERKAAAPVPDTESESLSSSQIVRAFGTLTA